MQKIKLFVAVIYEALWMTAKYTVTLWSNIYILFQII